GRGQRKRLAGADQMALLALWREPVADPEMGVDVVPRRRPGAQLLAQLADEHVDRPIAVGHRVTPHTLVDLLAAQDPIRARQQLEDLELTRGQLERNVVDVGLVEVRADRDLAEALSRL